MSLAEPARSLHRRPCLAARPVASIYATPVLALFTAPSLAAA